MAAVVASKAASASLMHSCMHAFIRDASAPSTPSRREHAARLLSNAARHARAAEALTAAACALALPVGQGAGRAGCGEGRMRGGKGAGREGWDGEEAKRESASGWEVTGGRGE